MNRRFGLTLLGAIVLVATGIGAYVWYSRSDNTGNAQSTLDLINNKLALNGEPTLPPGTDPNQPRKSNAAEPPTAVVTPGASPTPEPPSCGGGAITGGQEIVNAHGGVLGCGVYGSQMVFTTGGAAGGNGGIGTFQCATDDEACLRSATPKAPGAWSFFPAPNPGAVKILGWRPPDNLLINNYGEEMCFNLSTHEYRSSATCQ